MSSRNTQRGQAMILIAMAFVALAAFIGLAVDVGILYAQYGHLRRAVDAAALGAANQYREDVSYAEMEEVAQQYLELNNLDHATADVFVCNVKDTGIAVGSRPYHKPELCPDGWDGSSDFSTATERFEKLVEVEAQLPVEFAFLRVIGFNGTTIRASAQAEAAALDMMIAIDTSESMAYDGPVTDPDACNPNDCHPFEEVRQAAKDFVGEMFFPFDRIGVVSFAHVPTLHISVADGTDETSVKDAIDLLTVQSQPPPTCTCYSDDCDGDGDPDLDPSGCFTTNIADGLKVSGGELTSNGDEQAVWVVVLLSDGAANQASDGSGGWHCPGGPYGNPTWEEPFCRDDDPSEGNYPDASSTGAYGFDAEDAARAAGYLVGCHADGDPEKSTWCTNNGVDGIGTLIFTIGLGDKLTEEPDVSFPNAGEELLRRIAATGDDGDPSSNPCSSAPLATSCGNYYHAEGTEDLEPAFDSIADKIFTRITR